MFLLLKNIYIWLFFRGCMEILYEFTQFLFPILNSVKIENYKDFSYVVKKNI